ncbi:hypothetical protein [Arthrobacter tumbae]|uniref:hypothetical protein n=1 Tax=Arthrobacter tumbae TaxID=163874 RepID=UPI001959F8E7|nr:hypothetical protein [Arthrobacter tumbae]MBM7780547.1 cytochrome bd-type quinol oxidase subunit 2 [Arthrobacter tumbae]
MVVLQVVADIVGRLCLLGVLQVRRLWGLEMSEGMGKSRKSDGPRVTARQVGWAAVVVTVIAAGLWVIAIASYAADSSGPFLPVTPVLATVVVVMTLFRYRKFKREESHAGDSGIPS